MSEKGVCRTFLLFHCLLETDVVIFILADLSIWSYSLGHISCGFYRPVRSEEEEKQTLLSFFFLFCLIWSVCETANGFNYGEGEGEGGEGAFRKEGRKESKISARAPRLMRRHRKRFSDAVMAISDFSTLTMTLQF